MELIDISVEARNVQAGNQLFEVTGNRNLAITISKHGDPVNILSEDVPPGKIWTVEINVSITETDIE